MRVAAFQTGGSGQSRQSPIPVMNVGPPPFYLSCQSILEQLHQGKKSQNVTKRQRG